MHSGFNVPNGLPSRNSSMNSVASGGVQQTMGNMPGGRYPSNNIPIALSQMSHGNSHGGYSGIINRAGMNVVGSPGYSSNTNDVNGLIGSMVGSGNIGRTISSGGGGLSAPGLASRLNVSSNNGYGGVGVQGPNRLSSSVLQQASPQVLSMFGDSYSGGSLPQNHVQALNNFRTMGILNDENPKEGAPYTSNDFPQLGGRSNFTGGSYGQIGSLRKQGLGVSPIVQRNQEFSIQREDFPALPGFKAGGNADYGMDFQQKEQLHDNGVPLQSQQFSMGRSRGFDLDAMYSSHHPHQQHHSLSSIQQYQQQSQPQFRLQQMPSVNQTFRDQGVKSMQPYRVGHDPFGMLGLLSVLRMTDPDLTTLALGTDLMSLGLNLNSSENLYETFASPWSTELPKTKPEFTVPECYSAKPPPELNQGYFVKFQLQTLFYIFYSMPKDKAQLYAANELYNRGWFYHKEHRLWFVRVPNAEPLVRTNSYERGSYFVFDYNAWDTSLKENFVLHYELVDKRPALPPQ